MTSSLEWTKVHIEALKQNCIDYVAYNQPIPEDVLKNATAPLPEEWFNSTDYENETTVTPTPTQITTNGPITVTQNPGYFTSDLLDNLKDIGCPNDCNGNGVCQKGTVHPLLFKMYCLYLSFFYIIYITNIPYKRESPKEA